MCLLRFFSNLVVPKMPSGNPTLPKPPHCCEANQQILIKPMPQKRSNKEYQSNYESEEKDVDKLSLIPRLILQTLGGIKLE